MILDNLYTSLCDYGNMDGRLARALEWLKATDLKTLKGDKIVIDGQRIFAMVQSYKTIRPEESKGAEAHRVYIDIQMVISGTEVINWAPLGRTPKVKIPYNYEKDIVFFEDPAVFVPIRLDAGDFAVLYPTDVHMPKLAAAEPMDVSKVVVKVAL